MPFRSDYSSLVVAIWTTRFLLKCEAELWKLQVMPLVQGEIGEMRFGHWCWHKYEVVKSLSDKESRKWGG